MQVKWTKSAQRCLDKATEYGLREFGEITAARFYQKIRSYDALLAEHPRMGKVEPLLAGRRFEYRSLVVHDYYKLVYYICENSGVIYITNLFDTRREPKQLDEGAK